jgi:hypothetical protein
MQAMSQYGAEFVVPRQGAFDRFMDGLNRVPRPALALGTLGMFIAAMVDPLWFSQRMQGIVLVLELMWWLLGVIVSFYFGARHQVKSQKFQREIVGTMAHVPEVMHNIKELKDLRAESVGVADSGPDVRLSVSSIAPDANVALETWRKRNQ